MSSAAVTETYVSRDLCPPAGLAARSTAARPALQGEGGTGRASTSGCAATRHDTLDAYRYSECRCPRARAEATRAQKIYRLRVVRDGHLSVDSTGTHRRIQALSAVGWRAQDIATTAGMTDRGVSLLLTRSRVYLRTAQRIAAAYDQLADHPGPSATAARRAAAKGWLQPLWWDEDTIDDPSHTPPTDRSVHWSDVDPVAVERAIAGERLSLTRAERISAVEHLHARGANDCEISRRLGVDPAQVWRYRNQSTSRIAS